MSIQGAFLMITTLYQALTISDKSFYTINNIADKIIDSLSETQAPCIIATGP